MPLDGLVQEAARGHGQDSQQKARGVVLGADKGVVLPLWRGFGGLAETRSSLSSTVYVGVHAEGNGNANGDGSGC